MSGLARQLHQLEEAGRQYDDALRRAGIARANMAEDRNRLDGEVYEARKRFLSLLDRLKGGAT